jgi:hypothetical protein
MLGCCKNCPEGIQWLLGQDESLYGVWQQISSLLDDAVNVFGVLQHYPP